MWFGMCAYVDTDKLTRVQVTRWLRVGFGGTRGIV